MAQRAGVSFELERLDVEGDELVVSGHWSGVRGLRFVRPTLVASDRRILATLEHKPWAPSLDSTWTAAFPWDGDVVDADELALAVSPQVIVPLGEGTAVPEPATAPVARTPVRAVAVVSEPQPEPAPPAVMLAPEPAPEPAPAAEPEPAYIAPALSLDAARIAALESEVDDLARALANAERDRERALAQLAEAVAAREAAVRTRARMELAQEEAFAERERAEAALAAAEAQRDEANAQRDEVLLAYRALQRHVQAERAQEDRAVAPPDPDGADPDEPIGVRTMPAARTVMAELQRPTKPVGRLPFSALDLWVVRVLGTVAAGCFILLLISILRVFI